MSEEKMQIATAIVVASLAGSAQAAGKPTLCEPQEKLIMACHAKGKTYALCASATLTPASGYLQYRAGTAAGIEFAYPARREPPAGRFRLEHHTAGAISLVFTNGAYTYAIGETAGGMNSIYVDKNGQRVARIACQGGTGDGILGNDNLDLLRAGGIDRD